MENKINFQPPITIGFPPGAGSPREAAIAFNEQNTKVLVDLGKTSKGGKGRKKNGGTDKIVVAMIKPMYPDPAAGTLQAANAITLNGMSNLNQMHVNNALTGSKVTLVGGCGCDKFGGRKRGKRRKGGTHIMGPNQTWGCYSGGRTRKTRKTRKIRKTRKTRKTRKLRQTRKTRKTRKTK